jgi:hypothetical protein
LVIENWSLAIEIRLPNRSMAFKNALPERHLDMFNLPPPASRCRFPAAGSGKSLPRSPQNVKEQARERHTRATLPRFDGTATFIFTFIFHLNLGGGNKLTQQPDLFF